MTLTAWKCQERSLCITADDLPAVVAELNGGSVVALMCELQSVPH